MKGCCISQAQLGLASWPRMLESLSVATGLVISFIVDGTINSQSQVITIIEVIISISIFRM